MKLNCKLLATTITFIILTTNTYAQDYSFRDYDWDNKKTPITIPENYKNEKEVVLFRNIKIELDVKGKEVKQYYLIHEKTYINSNDAIERNNKIYIPFKMDESAIVTKLRVIQKDGKTITLDKKDIKEEVDEEKQLKYNYFAITGLDKGSVIEKIFILAEIPDLDGKTFRMQSNVPIAQNEFQLIFPKHLKFKTE